MRNKMEMNHVLVVEDDKEIREGAVSYTHLTLPTIA